MDQPIIARFVDRESGKQITGQIQTATELDLLGWALWRYHRQDVDKDWDWGGIFVDCAESAGMSECYSARVGTTLHGLMVLDLNGRSVGGQHWLILDYLATNPVNRAADSGLKHIGTAFVAVAILRSIECGFAGRLWLESLAGAQNFYANLGMNKSSRRSNEGHLIYTLQPKAAAELLEEIKAQRINRSVKKQIDLEKAATAEAFGVLAARGRTKSRASSKTKPNHPSAAQLKTLNRALCAILDFARESGATHRPVKAGNVSFTLQEHGAEEILSVRKLVA